MHSLTALQDAHLQIAAQHIGALAQWQHLARTDPAMFKFLLGAVIVGVIFIVVNGRKIFGGK
jgi:hypothetical protein